MDTGDPVRVARPIPGGGYVGAPAQGPGGAGPQVSGTADGTTAPMGYQTGYDQGSTAAYGQPPSYGGPAPQAGPAMFQGSAPDIQTPTWNQWQGWNPFQMAAYRTNIEALGPGVWNQVQSGLQSDFASQGGSPNITAMQAAAATPEQSAGQAMTANLFGQTTPQWQSQQQKQWSQAQAPQVKQNLTGIAA
jgi:hypothetical protein